jgi:hypothetical protein
VANDTHRQAEVDDLFAQWDSDPLDLLTQIKGVRPL